MGRHAGWAAAACGLAADYEGAAPHVLLMPEVAFNQARFLTKVEQALERYSHCVIAVSEGVKGPDGKFLSASGEMSSATHMPDSHPVSPSMSANGMVRPCSCPVSDRSWQGAPKTRSTLCPTISTTQLP